MNVLKLKGKIVENGINIEMLARTIGIHKSSLYRKLEQTEKFTVGDAVKIKKALGLSSEEAAEIFLC